jgi:hypothetical protein
MAMVMPVDPAWALDGGLKSNRAGIRWAGGWVAVVGFEELQPATRQTGSSNRKIFVIKTVLS